MTKPADPSAISAATTRIEDAPLKDLLGGQQVQRQVPIREQVANILRDAIGNLTLRPGQVLIERELCEMTGASRPSVREALRQLEAEGLVESINGKGTVVVEITPEHAKSVYQVRAELEGLAAELFTLNATDAHVADLGDAVAELATLSVRDEIPDAAELLACKNRVYQLLFDGAGNPTLTKMIKILMRQVTQLRALTLAQPGRPAESVHEIQGILAAIEARDPTGARLEAANHVLQASATLLRALDNQ